MTSSRKNRNSVPKVFTKTPIHVLYSNFTKIVRQKNFAKPVFGAILRPFGGGDQTFVGERAVWPYVSLIPEKVILYDHSIYAVDGHIHKYEESFMITLIYKIDRQHADERYKYKTLWQHNTDKQEKTTALNQNRSTAKFP